ncbi:hypothetical protein ACEO96_18920 [Vibrio anguillarum]|uniref:hypothetical protein n=1 Tax=Vibrio anguillarum TaxID=55601 RepID=UPI0012FD605B|nr:hypothetical protein [Vibrio anguillarum]MBT2949663.1 hypothetical protein [Vibrio anguillarum]
MNILEVMLVSFGGTAVALSTAAFLSKKLLGHWFNKELEEYKAKIGHENSIALESVKTDLQKALKQDERSYELEKIMSSYKGPLIHAVYDLQSRIYNIVKKNLINVYYTRGDNSQKEYVLNNTAFLIAQFFAWNEIIRKEIQFIEFDNIENTRSLSDLKDQVYSLWQTDSYDDDFYIWAGDQRGIGEVMIDFTNGKLTSIGYAEFLKVLDRGKEPLLIKLQEKVKGLLESDEIDNDRLIGIQHSLIDMLKFLDPECIRFPKKARSYI